MTHHMSGGEREPASWETATPRFDVRGGFVLSKPFSPRELLARMRAIVRRARGQLTRPTTIEVGKLTINEATRIATWAGQPLELTTAEFDLLDSCGRQRRRHGRLPAEGRA